MKCSLPEAIHKLFVISIQFLSPIEKYDILPAYILFYN